MRLRTAVTLWARTAPRARRWPRLRANTTCDVLVIGAGIVGAMIARQLSARGVAVVLVDAGRVGAGSTAASTALLLYELDTELVALGRLIGRRNARHAYRISLAALRDVRRLVRELDDDCGHRDVTSLYVAFDRAGARRLPGERAARRAIGLAVDHVGPEELRRRYGLRAFAALRSADAGVVDPLRLCRGLVASAAALGAAVHERTEALAVRRDGRGYATETTDGRVIRSAHVVAATGYLSASYVPEGGVTLRSSYVIASRPTPALRGTWLADHVLWETARPYAYVRTTTDGRIVVGGEDLAVVAPGPRDRHLPRQAARLLAAYRTKVGAPAFRPAMAWTGTFAETKDGLGYIDSPRAWPRLYVALGFGGNGITFAAIAARRIAALVRGRRPADLALFALDRDARPRPRAPRSEALVPARAGRGAGRDAATPRGRGGRRRQ